MAKQVTKKVSRNAMVPAKIEAPQATRDTLEYDAAREYVMKDATDANVVWFYTVHAFPEYQGRASTLTDTAAILEAVLSVDTDKYEDVETLDEKRTDAMREREQAPTDQVEIEALAQSAAAIERFAMEQAEHISSATLKTISGNLDSVERSKNGVLMTLFGLRRDFGAKLNTWPIPGTTKEMVKGTNIKVWDKHDRIENGKPVVVSFYDPIYASTKDGLAITQSLEKIKEDMKTDTSFDLKDKKRYWSKRLDDGANDIRLAMQIYHQIYLIENMPKVEIAIYQDQKTGEVQRTNTPIVLAPAKGFGDPIKETAGYRPKQFAKLKPVVALKNGGTLAALKATLKKGTTKQGRQIIVTQQMPLKTAIEVLTQLRIYFDPKSPQGQLHLAQLSKAMADPKEGDENVNLLGDLFTVTFADIWSEIMATYQTNQTTSVRTRATKEGEQAARHSS